MIKTLSRQRLWQIKQKEKGVCTICGKRPIHKSDRCEKCYEPYKIKCREYMREYMRKRREGV